MPTRDFAVTQGVGGVMVLHRADCPHARQLAAEGEPVMTLLDCARQPTPDSRLIWHHCLHDQQEDDD